MPIEIKELIIRATVDAQANKQDNKMPLDDQARLQLVEECVEQVLEILRKQRER